MHYEPWLKSLWRSPSFLRGAPDCLYDRYGGRPWELNADQAVSPELIFRAPVTAMVLLLQQQISKCSIPLLA